MFDYSKLIGLVASLGLSGKDLEKMTGINNATLSKKFRCVIEKSGKRWYFNVNDILQLCKALGIAQCDIGTYFFTLKVQ